MYRLSVSEHFVYNITMQALRESPHQADVRTFEQGQQADSSLEICDAFQRKGSAACTCDIPIPTVNAAADVAAWPTKGKAGSMTMASFFPNRLQKKIARVKGENRPLDN